MSVRVPEHIARIGPYVPGTPIEEAERRFGLRQPVKLASNENPLGPSPKAIEAIRSAAPSVHRYPDSRGHALREALAGSLRVAPDRIVLGNGSTEIVELLAKAFLADGHGAVAAAPAFVMYAIAVRAMNAPLELVPLRDDRHDLPAMASACRATTALVYLGNPNNPTGTHVGRRALERYFDQVPRHVLTVVDEAYRDYVEAPDYPDCLEFLAAGRSVVVLRTFSKIHGLAGLRIGYAVADEAVAGALEAVRSPFNTSHVAQAAAIAALGDRTHVERSRAENSREAAFVAAELRRRGLAGVSTVCNFFLLRTALGGDELYVRMLRLGVIVRSMTTYGYGDAVRVSIGTRAENLRFLSALDRALAAAPAGAARDATGT